MKEVYFSYGKGKMKGSFEESRLVGLLESHLHAYPPLWERWIWFGMPWKIPLVRPG